MRSLTGGVIFSSCHAPEAIPAAMATPKAVVSGVVVRTIKTTTNNICYAHLYLYLGCLLSVWFKLLQWNLILIGCLIVPCITLKTDAQQTLNAEIITALNTQLTNFSAQ